MTAVGELVLVLGLLVSTHCEVRARDPEVEQEEEELGGRAAEGEEAFRPHLKRLQPGVTETPPLGERGSYPAQTGIWCAFVQKRVVTMAVACGTEKYTIRSQSSCPSGTPGCQLIMYKLSTRPVYRQKQQIFTSLIWRCCPGHGGDNCEETVSEARVDPGSLSVIGEPETTETEVQAPVVQERVDPHQEQNDHQTSVGELHPNDPNNTSTDPTPDPPTDTHDLRQQELLSVVDELDPPPVLPVPHMMALVMSQLQPVLAGFNRSLELLSRQVGDLARDVTRLKSSQREPVPQEEPFEGTDLEEVAEERLEAKLDEVFEHIKEVRRQIQSQRTHLEKGLHSQNAMLHYNLTSLKTDVDMKLKRHQKMLQVSLQAMNSTLADMKLDQDRIHEDRIHEDQPEAPVPPPRPSDTSALWGAVERLDNMVVNNTVKVGVLTEDVEGTAGDVQQLRRTFKDLEKLINQTARSGQIKFMETGLEVEAAKEAVLRRVGELAGNLSLQGEHLQEMDVDVDYLYTALYKQNSSADCGCKGLEAAVARLERGVANVTELANENRLTLEENGDAAVVQWGGATDWEPAVEALQRNLQEVRDSLASEENRTRVLELSLNHLSGSLGGVLAEVSALKESDRKMVEEMQRVSGSFNSLLKDAIRHSDVLELLLGEEVLEFLEWRVEDQEAHSIPALKEQLREHNLSITSLLGRSAGRSDDEVPSAETTSSSSHLLPDGSIPGSMRRTPPLLHPQGRGPEQVADGSDLWNLEKRVEELSLKVLRLEEKRGNASAREAPPGRGEANLQAEVTWLKRGLEEHLRMFKNVFSNSDILEGSGATLELDQLWQLLKKKEGRREKKKRGGGNQRSRRDSGDAPVPSSQSEASLLLVARSPLGVSDEVVRLRPTMNRAGFYSETGTFTAPAEGIYLFVLTLDLRPGPAHVLLRRGSGGAAVSLHQREVTRAGPVTGVGLLALHEGEEVRLELKGGARAESEDNVFTVLLLYRTT